MRYTILHWVTTKIFLIGGRSWDFQYMNSTPRSNYDLPDRMACYDQSSLISVWDYPLPVIDKQDDWIKILKPCYYNFCFRGVALNGWSIENAGYIWAKNSNYPVTPKPTVCEDCGWVCEQQCFKFNSDCYLTNLVISV